MDALVLLPAILLIVSLLWMAARVLRSGWRTLASHAERRREARAAWKVAEEQRRQDAAAAAKTREEQERVAAEERRKDAKLQAEKQAPRDAARRYYEANAALAEDDFSRELFMAYMQLDMAEEKSPAELWAAYRALIEKLTPVIRERKAKDRDEARRRLQQERQLREIDAQVRECEADIGRIRAAPMDEEVREHELEALRRRLRDLERERERILEHVGGEP